MSFTISNKSSNNVAFDDKTLLPSTSVMVARLSDDILAGYFQGALGIDPPPDRNALNAMRTVHIDHCQLPLPVAIHSTVARMYTPTRIVDGLTFNVNTTPQQLFVRDDSRCAIRLRNVGSNRVYIGGETVSAGGAFHVLDAGDTFEETFAPNVEWWAVGVGLTTLAGITIHTV